MFDTKLSFTLYDLIGHIMPGGFAIILTAWVFHITISPNSFTTTTVFIILSYVFGHLLHAISSWILQKVWWFPKELSSFFDKIISKVRYYFLMEVRGTSSELKERIRTELIRAGLVKKGDEVDSLDLYDYCSNILIEAGSVSERSILESKEAFYRSLIPTAIYSAIILNIKPPLPIFKSHFFILFTTIIIIEFLYYRREYYRRIKNNQIYKQALIKLQSRKNK